MEEEIVGDYRGAWFELTANIDLGGMDWNPIGYYRDDSEFSGEVTHPFTANLDGNGYKISNFRFAGGIINCEGVASMTLERNKNRIRYARNIS